MGRMTDSGVAKSGVVSMSLSLLYCNSSRCNKAGGNVGNQDHCQQYQAGSPRLAMIIVERRHSVLINHYGKRRGGLAKAVGPKFVVERGEEKRRAFARNTSHAQNHSGED